MCPHRTGIDTKRLNCQRFFLFCRDTLQSRSITKNEFSLCWALVARCQIVFIGHFKAQAGHQAGLISLIVKEVETRDEAEESKKQEEEAQ